MKSTILFIVTFLILASCKNQYVQYDENIEFKDSVCKTVLDGFSEFKINRTTVFDIQQAFDKSQASEPDDTKESFKPTFRDGFMLFNSDSLASLLQQRTNINQYVIPGMYGKYKVGEIEVEDLYLLCINDTLIGILIHYVPDLIKEGFITKYGEGVGSYTNKSFIDYKDPNKDKLDVSEYRMWKNNNVIAEYTYKVSNNTTYNKNTLRIYDKSKLDKVEQIIVNLYRLLENQNKRKIQKSLELI